MIVRFQLWRALWKLRRSIGLPAPLAWHWALVKYLVTGKLTQPKGWTVAAGFKYLEAQEPQSETKA